MHSCCLQAGCLEGSKAVTADRWQNITRSESVSPVTLIRCVHVSDVTRDPADAAHADAAVSSAQRGATQARGGRGPGRTAAQVSGAEQSGGDEMPTEEESLGDVLRKESRGAHSDQHAASGTKPCDALRLKTCF